MVEERSLSIRETAELIGVCENTLRDWDHNGKLVALRTLGGHRRYSLNDIRDFLKNNPVYLTKKEDDIGVFEEEEKRMARTPLQVLMENSALYCQNCESKLTANQMLWLIETAWGLSRFKNLVSIQAMQGPAALCFVKKDRVTSIPLAAKSELSSFSIFLKEDFEKLKDVYARALADYLDSEIFQRLVLYTLFDFESFQDFIFCSKDPLNLICDYVIAPKPTIEYAQKNLDCTGVEFFEHDPFFDSKTFTPLIMVGTKKKIEENFCEPIFMPYLIATSTGLSSSNCRLLLRSAWYTKEVKEKKEKEEIKLCDGYDPQEYSMGSKDETSSSNEKTQ